MPRFIQLGGGISAVFSTWASSTPVQKLSAGIDTFESFRYLNLNTSAVARVSEAPPEISRGAPHTLLAYYYELQ